MLGEAKNYLSELNSYILKFKKYINDRTLITDLLTKLIITFGVVLIVGGLYLMTLTQVALTNSATRSVISSMDWIPGIPFYIHNLVNVGFSTVGLVSWFLGIDLILVGLGLWVRHQLARLTALLIFALAAAFQFVQFLFVGIVGSPASVVELLVDVSFIYFLSLKFDSQKLNKVVLTS